MGLFMGQSWGNTPPPPVSVSSSPRREGDGPGTASVDLLAFGCELLELCPLFQSSLLSAPKFGAARSSNRLASSLFARSRAFPPSSNLSKMLDRNGGAFHDSSSQRLWSASEPPYWM